MHVLVIGGGVAGNALALFLERAGIRATVYEAYDTHAPVGGGFSIAPNGMNVLAALGVADEVKARGCLAAESCFRNQRGRLLARLSNGTVAQYGQPAVSMMRAVLHDALHGATRRQGITTEYGKRLQHISYDDDTTVRAHFEDGTSATGDLLVGADGIHSRTRRSILPDGPQPSYVGITAVGGRTPLRALPPMMRRERKTVNFTFGIKGFFGYCGVDEEHLMWWSNMAQPRELTRAELADVSVPGVVRSMLDIYGGFHAPIPALITHTDKALKINIHDIQSLPRWSERRVVLIGDAAHAVSPNAGQGASLALEDAMLLAKLLAAAPDDHARVFAQFEAERKPRVERVVAEGRRRGDDKQEVSPFQARVRDIIMTVLFRLDRGKSQDWLYRYKVEWGV
jgi:2-polyprenyl-6-methoxyphenol hydroxylase-like FAD-dependent oxidoreductase